MDKIADNLKSEIIVETVNMTGIVPLMILRDKYGFGKKRLTEFIEHFRDYTDSIYREYVSYDDMAKTLLDETGLDVFDGINESELE